MQRTNPPTSTRSELLKRRIEESIRIRQALLTDTELSATVALVVGEIVDAIRNDGKVLLCGNGGSAADAQHLAAELVGKFTLDRDPFPAIALADNVAALTAISNDYSYETAYSRAVRAFGRPGDVLIGLSTSGESANVVAAIDAADALGLVTVALTGPRESAMSRAAQYQLRADAPTTASIQEVHKLLGHTIFELVELELCG